jgi:hypothetical protein
MKTWLGLTVAVSALLWSHRATAQSSDPAGPTGTGPRVDVQVSPNGTLDVGGARGADVDLTGENFRGSFGASRSQTGSSPSPALPIPGLPGGRSPFGAPNFGPSMPGGLPRGDGGTLHRNEDESSLSDLILPRFRRGPNGNAWSSSARQAAADSWRYQFFRGRWWYWQPAQAWVYWDGSQWRGYPLQQ